MTAEEKLQELYKREKGDETPEPTNYDVNLSGSCGVHIAAEDIDLVADLVVERLFGKPTSMG
ncbi:hypothetical protein LCGC14_0383220 [marine sediment metagenome]|uniref:Uncharacterized protein n=1 Tax=marine sediment metagenome TaxID=412755 RepID=A0A0F9WAJ8_9ZZZZ